MQLDHLTFTRFLAALTVVFFHYGSNVSPVNIQPFNAIFQAGPIAVSYFYALSGFIMAIAYYRPETPSNFNQWKYWLARFARIYPVYLLALLLVFAANILTLKNESNPLSLDELNSQLILNIFMLQAWVPDYPLSLNSPGWSLSVEAFFYLCFPFLLYWLYRGGLKQIMWFSLILWLVTQILHTYLLNTPAYTPHNSLHDFIYYNPLMHINTFIAGLLVGIYFRGTLSQPTVSQSNRWWLIGVLVLIAVLLMSRKSIESYLGINIDYTNGLLAPLFLASIILFARERGTIAKLFSASWLVLLGEASYSLYILQRPIYGIYQKFIGSHINVSEQIHFYLYLLLLIAVSIASYKLFETPLRRWINTWYRPAPIYKPNI